MALDESRATLALLEWRSEQLGRDLQILARPHGGLGQRRSAGHNPDFEPMWAQVERLGLAAREVRALAKQQPVNASDAGSSRSPPPGSPSGKRPRSHTRPAPAVPPPPAPRDRVMEDGRLEDEAKQGMRRLVSTGSLRDHYSMGRVLGQGATSTVRQGRNKATGQEVAVKIISKSESPPLWLCLNISCRKARHPNSVFAILAPARSSWRHNSHGSLCCGTQKIQTSRTVHCAPNAR